MKKTLLAAAALTGLLAGTSARAAVTQAPVSTDGQKTITTQQQTSDAGFKATTFADDTDKHDCKGKNACKGKGGCKTDKNDCKGQNACKGQGGCKTNK